MLVDWSIMTAILTGERHSEDMGGRSLATGFVGPHEDVKPMAAAIVNTSNPNPLSRFIFVTPYHSKQLPESYALHIIYVVQCSTLYVCNLMFREFLCQVFFCILLREGVEKE
ncbi:MAG TPA: hypothetical protein DCE44_13915 [Verrucomicrobiales bacterium]|nr:hypothetical protein [Verrucomicrobiales bacterium]